MLKVPTKITTRNRPTPTESSGDLWTCFATRWWKLAQKCRHSTHNSIFLCICKTHICVDIEKIHIDTHKTARRYLLVHCLVLEIYDAQPVYGLHRIAWWYREWSLNRPASRYHPHTHTYLAECKCIFIHEGLALVLSRGHWARSHVLNTWHNKGSHGCIKLQPLGVSVMILHVMCTNA